jgi:Tfp pilus assembly protein PilF
MADDPSQEQELPEHTPAQIHNTDDKGDDTNDDLVLPNPLILAGIGLALLAAVTFLPTLRGQPTWLDDVSFTDNPFVQAPDGVGRVWTSADPAGRYQPMTLTSFWLEYRLVQDNPVAAHFVNVLLHVGVVLLLWTLLRKLNVPGAWFAAALFAVHPVHAQAVAWISGRAVVLASLFYLSSLLVYLRFLGVTQAAEVKTLFTLPPEPERLWLLAFVLFLCAMACSAATALTFPIAVLVILWWRQHETSAKDGLSMLPFFIASLAVGIWTAWLENTSPAARGLIAAFGKTSPLASLASAPRAIWFYLLKIVLPHPLIFDYPRWTPDTALSAASAAALVVLLALLWVLRSRLGRAPLAAILLFCVIIAPMLNLLDPPAIRYSFVSDYRQYLASTALIVLIASFAADLVLTGKLKGKLNPVYCAAALLIVVLVLTFHQGTFYLTNEGLWRHNLEVNQNSLLATEGYADALIDGLANANDRDHQLDAARQWYIKAQSVAPNDPRAAVGLGTVAAASSYEVAANGHPDQAASQQSSAEQYFRDAIHLDPDYRPAYIALAKLLSLKHDEADEILALKEAVRIEPQSLRARLELGSAQRKAGQLTDAEATLTELLEDAPKVSAVHTELGDVYIQQHNVQSALAEWQKAVQLDPSNTAVLLNFGALLDSSGQPALAAKQFLAATLIDPTNIQAYEYLARIYDRLGYRHDAVEQFRRALELNPTSIRIQNELTAEKDNEKRLGSGASATSQAAAPPDGGMPTPVGLNPSDSTPLPAPATQPVAQ